MGTGRSPDSGSLLTWGKQYLKKAGIEDSDISAEVLLGNLLGLNRHELLLAPRKNLDSPIIEKYEKLIIARSRNRPLQYLVGYVDFYNVKLKCDQRALIPRPETEILVENVITKMKNTPSPKILDIGSGSGNIAIALAKNIKASTVIGVDISTAALELAIENARLNNLLGRVRFIEGDILDGQFIKTLGMFDCVAANPPYVAENEMEQLPPEVVEHEPEIALISKDDPLKYYKNITETAHSILAPGGVIAFEMGFGQSSDVEAILSENFENIEIIKDLSGTDRIIFGILKGKI